MVQTVSSHADPGRRLCAKGTAPPPAERGLGLDAATAASVAQHLAAGTDVAEVAGRAVRCAVDHVAGARWATVTTTTRGVLTTVACADPAAATLDRWQAAAEQGPVWLTTSGQEAFAQSTDMTSDVLWTLPEMMTGAAPAARAVLTVQLPAPSGVAWALNVYADAPDAFTEHSTDTLRVLAVHIGIAMTAAHIRSNLQRAIASRDVIGQAKGMLMQRYRLKADRAFELLKRISQSNNRKLVAIAEQLALTGDLPELSSHEDSSASAPDPGAL